MPNTPLKLFLADDHAFIRDGIKLLLGNYSNFEVVGEAASYPETLKQLQRQPIDYLVLDYQMPGGNGLSGISSIRRKFPDIGIVLLTGVASGTMLNGVLAAGIKAVILKEGAGDELLTALKMVESGEIYVSEEAKLRLDSNPQNSLTKRERQVLSMIASGLKNAEIADSLGVSIKTVDNHRANLMKKLGLHNTAEVVAFAIREGDEG